MKLTVSVEHLREALSKILPVVARKNPRPILTYCCLKADQENLFLEGTDLEVSARTVCNANVIEPGSLCLNPKNLFDLVKEIPHREIHLETSPGENLLHLNSAQINISLLVCPTEEFPNLVFSKDDFDFELTGKDLLYIIDKISYAVGHDETRIFLNGIFLQQIEHKARAVATNGYTFALIESDRFNSPHDVLSKGIIIPRKGITEIKKIAEQASNQHLGIAIDESFFYINFKDQLQLSIRLIPRDYPPYQLVIPENTSSAMVVARNDLLNAIRRIKVLADDKSNAIKFSLHTNKLIVSANHPLLGEAKEELVINYTGNDMVIGFNARYIVDSLSVLDSSEITLEFTNELGAVLIKTSEVPTFLGIIMPLKL